MVAAKPKMLKSPLMLTGDGLTMLVDTKPVGKTQDFALMKTHALKTVLLTE